MFSKFFLSGVPIGILKNTKFFIFNFFVLYKLLFLLLNHLSFEPIKFTKEYTDIIDNVSCYNICILQQLITHDTKSNVYDYKHTFCVDLVPIIKDSLICLKKTTAQHLGNMDQFVLCLRITNVVTLIDPKTLQTCEVTS